MQDHDAGAGRPDDLVRLHPDTIRDVAYEVSEAVVGPLRAGWEILIDRGPKDIADAVAKQLGKGWPKLGEERLRRREAEQQLRQLQARETQEIARRLVTGLRDHVPRIDVAIPLDALADLIVSRLPALVLLDVETLARQLIERIEPRADDRPLLTVREAADRLGISETSARALIGRDHGREPRLPSVVIGDGARRVLPADLDAYVASRRTAVGLPSQEGAGQSRPHTSGTGAVILRLPPAQL